MRRTHRLFEILQMFRRGRVLRARKIAERLEISVRTVYRDIDTLRASGVPIEGERGVGFLVREPIFLPPLTLTPEELRALHLGVEVVRQMGDPELSKAASELFVKVRDVLPSSLRRGDSMNALSVYLSEVAFSPGKYLRTVQEAVRRRQILEIEYSSLSEELTQRRIRPLQTEYWGRSWTCAAWCELRSDFRVFRLDRIRECQRTHSIFPDEKGRRYSDFLKKSSETM